ncbi:hypothetical protein FRACYDRAFT_265802 [Fragilariopsis cylindrus CCMP1102]|uniref:Uncharacterized protein n=1 Tax=Fragilariopsis cylindrus CCMP1102 TaxID=635003 RepID=A0A1E7EL69_9STRA|nr:hypothetical protein FRACYDRAFT_265802 [Fragilariopsis cylindrus CCMP1102]|eukprot:OEU06661.1 hypothetical protein FRACYDRAFT_265802 [Fragilariopsis cylindrus CCMP1102]
MSGSDLALFVAAVLRDEELNELITEINVLQSRLTESKNERLVVQITGENGTPIYGEESFRNAERYDDDDDNDDEIILSFDKGRGDDITTDGFPLSSLPEIKVTMGGVIVQRFNIDDPNIQFDDELYDEENRMEYIHIDGGGNGPIVSVHGKLGPLPLGWGQRHTGGDDIVLTDLLEEVADENNELTPQTLIIEALTFREKDVTVYGFSAFVVVLFGTFNIGGYDRKIPLNYIVNSAIQDADRDG